MVGALFTISAINIARAAMHAADRLLPPDAAYETHLDSHDPEKIRRLYVRVSTPAGQTREVDVDDEEIRACLDMNTPTNPTQTVSDLAMKIAEAVRTILP